MELIWNILLSLYCNVIYLFPIFFHRSPIERCFYSLAKIAIAHRWELSMVPSMAHRWRIDGPWQKGRRTIDGSSMGMRWCIDGPWMGCPEIPNRDRIVPCLQKSCFQESNVV